MNYNMRNSQIKSIISYTYPKLHVGKEWYVGFMAFDPVAGNMKRKKIKVNHIEKIAERRRMASDLISRLTIKLSQGWNPWIESESSAAYFKFDEVCEKYKAYLTKMQNDDSLREKTLYDYCSKLSILKAFNNRRRVPITYIYQFDRYFVTEFLDYVYLKLENSPRTRNNYLCWLSTFSTYLLQRMFIKEKPTDGMQFIRMSNRSKDRDIILDNDLVKIHEYLETTNKHFLLACYMLHYVLIRPKEMAFLKIRDFHLQKQTVSISGDFSKNRKDAIVTLPEKVIRLMLELKIFDSPGSYYLFSDNFKPGRVQKSEKNFRDFWARHIRKDLNFGKRYKFYSLKDTGITNMLRSCDVVTVRDQARHSSILITDLYTPADIKNANALLLKYDGVL